MPARDLARWARNEDGSWGRHPEYQPEPVSDADATKGAQEAAEELGVDLASVSGTGKEGKVTKADVEKAAAGE